MCTCAFTSMCMQTCTCTYMHMHMCTSTHACANSWYHCTAPFILRQAVEAKAKEAARATISAIAEKEVGRR